MSIGLLKSSSRKGGGYFFKSPITSQIPCKKSVTNFWFEKLGLGGYPYGNTCKCRAKEKIGIIKIFNIHGTKKDSGYAGRRKEAGILEAVHPKDIAKKWVVQNRDGPSDRVDSIDHFSVQKNTGCNVG